jgi:hypothetical protein
MERNMANVSFTPQQVDQLVAAIKASPAGQGAGAPAVFCQNWDTAKSVLQSLQPILGGLPGIGIFAGPAISLAIVAGDAAKKALC